MELDHAWLEAVESVVVPGELVGVLEAVVGAEAASDVELEVDGDAALAESGVEVVEAFELDGFDEGVSFGVGAVFGHDVVGVVESDGVDAEAGEGVGDLVGLVMGGEAASEADVGAEEALGCVGGVGGVGEDALGGDDGVAVAMALAILDNTALKHPKLEVVLTVDEEVGLCGAECLDTDKLSGRYLINLDSEDEGVFLTGSAVRKLQPEPEEVPQKKKVSHTVSRRGEIMVCSDKYQQCGKIGSKDPISTRISSIFDEYVTFRTVLIE